MASAKDLLRSHVNNIHFPLESWGFDIARCTYVSQEKFEEFMTLITADAMDYLCDDSDEDLRESFQLKVIEDKTLDGATWKQARRRFDEKVREELERTPDDIAPEDAVWMAKRSEAELIEGRVSTRPDWEFFIFVDEQVIDSVVDCVDAREKKRGPGYFLKFVQSDLVRKETMCEDERGVPIDDCEEHEDCRIILYQKFKAWDVVSFYASVLNQDWYEGYERGDNGISEVIRV